MQRFGDPNERLRHRLAMEAKQEMTALNRDDELLRLRDAAKRLAISHHTLRSWALAGKCVYRRVGGLLMMIPESEIERLRNQLGN
jgi:phage antirepressor YoqD-like protein